MVAMASSDFSAWKDSLRIYINTTAKDSGASVLTSVQDFPLLIRLDDHNFNFSKAPYSPGDIRFSDPDGTELPSQISRWQISENDPVEIWVRVPKVDGNSNADFITMHWNNPAITDGLQHRVGKQSTFDSTNGFAGVWHMDEMTAHFGSKDAVRDASNAANHGDDSVVAAPELGMVGSCRNFNGESDYISITNSSTLNPTGPLTISAWIKPQSLAGTGTNADPSQVNPILRKGDVNPNTYQLSLASGHLAFSLFGNDRNGVQSQREIALNKWVHVAGVWDGNSVQLYLDGILDIDDVPNPPDNLGQDNRALYIGGRPSSPSDVSSQDYFHGSLDEVQMSRIARSKEWLHLAYENQKSGSSLLTFTVPTSQPSDSIKPDSNHWSHSQKIFLDLTTSDPGMAQNLEMFPVLVRFNKSLIDFKEVDPTGKDLRFSDSDGTELKHFVERWDGEAEKGLVWVLVPKVKGGEKSHYITLFWGNPEAINIQNGQSVFDTALGYVGVWPLDSGAALTGTRGAYRDITANNNRGDDFASLGSANAIIGAGQTFGGSSDFISIPNSPSMVLDENVSMSAWIKLDSFDITSGTVSPILRKGGEFPLSFQLKISKGVLAITIDRATYFGKTKFKAGQWYHVAGSWAKGLIRLYINGTLDVTVTGKETVLTNNKSPLYIGGNQTLTNELPNQFNGTIDNVVLSKVPWSSAWIYWQYQNQKPGSQIMVFEGKDNGNSVPPDTGLNNLDPSTLKITLAPGQNYIYKDLLKLSLPSNASENVLIQFNSSDKESMDKRGISNYSETFSLQGTDQVKTMPPVQVVRVNGSIGNQSIFQAKTGSGQMGVLWNHGIGVRGWELTEAGEYFFGRDTVEPHFRYIDNGLDASDSSWLEIIPEDNVQNLTITTSVTGAMDGYSGSSQKTLAGTRIRLTFKGRDDLSPLGIALQLWDGNLQGNFPEKSVGPYLLSKKLDALRAPIELDENITWKLAGIPLELDKPMLMHDLLPKGEVFGAIWQNIRDNPEKSTYRIYQDKDTVPVGLGLWLGSRKKIDGFDITNAHSKSPNASGHFSINLVKGWNQVTCPALAPIPWPVSHLDTIREDLSSIKGLQAFDLKSGSYYDVDSLFPWQGYFVYSRLDTVLVLETPSLQPVGKRMAQGKEPVPLQILLKSSAASVALNSNLEPVLRLGAAQYGQDAVGIEDGLIAPIPDGSASLSIVRSGQALRSDIVGLNETGIYNWKVVWNSAHPYSQELKRVKIADLRLPDQMEFWIGSKLRKVAQRVQSGSEVEILGDGSDTLDLWAVKIGERNWPVGFEKGPVERTIKWEASTNKLVIGLPQAAGIKVDLWELNGTKIGSLQRNGLAIGFYEFSFPACRNHSGLMAISVEFIGRDKPTRMILKSIKP